jgi:hypothetical protein
VAERVLSPEEVAALGLPTYTPPKVGAGETFALRGAGAVPAGGMLADLISTGVLQGAKALGVGDPGATLTPEALAELQAMGVDAADPGNPIPGPVDTYREIRDTRKERTAAGSQQNPTAGKAGAAVGTIASILAPLPKVTVGAGATTRGGQLASRIGSGAATGGAYGALSGATEGDADLTRGEVARAGEEILDRAAGGAAFGAAAAGGAELARPLAGRIKSFALKQGKQVLQGQSDIAAATRKPLSDEAVEEVLRSGGIRPMSTTQATYSRVDKMAEEQGAAYGALLKRLEELGVQGPKARELVDDIMREAEARFSTSMAGDPAARALQREGGRIEALARGATVGETRGVAGPMREALPLSQAEGLKRSAQDVGRYDRLNASPREEAYQFLGSRLRQGIEDSVEAAGQAAPARSETRRLAESFIPVKQRTARLLEARTAAERGAAKAEQRSPIGLKDVILGSATGEPLSALAFSGLSGVARNRLPSTLSSQGYSLAEALRTGAASPEVARWLTIAAEPDVTDTAATLAEALRKRTKKERKD